MLQFDAEVQTATFHSPLEEFEPVDVDVDVREDPLTGRQCRIVPESFPVPDETPDISAAIGDAEGCFFCPGTVEEATPTYPDWMGVDRGSVGEATSFPNLNPYGAHSNVVALTDEHFVPIDGFTVDQFADGFAAALEFVHGAFEHDEAAALASINMNYLRPAGSSIVHPHVQAIVDDRGTNEQALRIEPARAYYDANGSSYYADLVAAERGADDAPATAGRGPDPDRHVGATGDGAANGDAQGRVDWHAPFAPRHNYHLQGIAADAAVPPADPADPTVRGIAEGVTNALSYYAEVGLNSFNLAVHLVPDEPAVPPVVDVVARAVFDDYYLSDASFFTAIHDEGVVDVAPEAYGPEAAGAF